MIEIDNNIKELNWVLDAYNSKQWVRWDADAIQKLMDLNYRFNILPHPTDATKIKITKIIKL